MCHADLNFRRVTLEISAKKDSEKFSLQRVRTVRKLNLPVCQTVNFKSLRSKWKYIPEIDYKSFTNGRPVILLGQDNSDLIVSREVIEGPKQGPIISRTKLGWVVHGNNAIVKGRVDSELVCMTIDEPKDDLH
ncbi:unnamed protein product, partial [Allacma fusca]